MILNHSTRLEALVDVVANVIVLRRLLFESCIFLLIGGDALRERWLDSQANEFGDGRNLRVFRVLSLHVRFLEVLSSQ